MSDELLRELPKWLHLRNADGSVNLRRVTKTTRCRIFSRPKPSAGSDSAATPYPLDCSAWTPSVTRKSGKSRTMPFGSPVCLVTSGKKLRTIELPTRSPNFTYIRRTRSWSSVLMRIPEMVTERHRTVIIRPVCSSLSPSCTTCVCLECCLDGRRAKLPALCGWDYVAVIRELLVANYALSALLSDLPVEHLLNFGWRPEFPVSDLEYGFKHFNCCWESSVRSARWKWRRFASMRSQHLMQMAQRGALQ